MFNTIETEDLAEWIIDDTSFVFFSLACTSNWVLILFLVAE